MTVTILKVVKTRCSKWLNIESGITHEPSECPDYSTRVVKDWNIIESGEGHSEGSCLMPLTIFNPLPLLCCSQGGSRGLFFYSTFNIISVIYHTCAVVNVFRSLMFYATFNIWSFTTLLLKAGGSRVSLFMPLSILFQSFTTPEVTHEPPEPPCL
jgi:hypothetical protein